MPVARSMKTVGFLGLLVGSVAALGSARWQQQQERQQPQGAWRARFNEAALKIPFEKDLPPQRDGADASARGVPVVLRNMRIAVARTRDTGQAGHIDFRVTSDSVYPRLGIAPGLNYVWKDFVDGKMRLLVIPADSRYRLHWLIVQSHNHPPPVRVPRLVIAPEPPEKMSATSRRGASNEPRVFALAVCTDECRNVMSWCTAHDTTARSLVGDATLSAIQRYFVRNRVAWAAR